MGTSNFHNVNSGRIYSIEIQEDWEYDDLKDNLISELSNTSKTSSLNFSSGGTDTYELRSYPSNVLGRLTKWKCYGNTFISVSIYSVIRSGYYEGCNLDWFIEVEIEGKDYIDEIPQLDDITDSLTYNNEWNIGFSKIQSKNVLKWIETTKEELVNIIEKIYEENSEPLEVVGRFSNGETLYKKV